MVNEKTSLTFGNFLRDTVSKSANVASFAGNLSIGVDWTLEIWPLTLSGDLAYSHTGFKNLIIGYTGKRMDDNVSFELALTHENIQFYGLNPTFGVNWARNFSNLNRYDTETVQVFTRLTAAF